MKLIDVLVKELPKNGGWLRDVKTMTQDRNGDIWGYDCVSPYLDRENFWSSKSGEDLVRNSKIEVRDLAADWSTAIITREQYEAALAAKNDGWIEWGGGECPVDDGEVVDVMFGRGGRIISTNIADFWRWSHSGTDSDIISYRLHKPQEAIENDDEDDLNECIGQDVTQVWSGEGLPPVGCECEYTMQTITGDDWNQCTVDYVGSSFVVYRDCCGVELSCSIGCIKFRPIRSEADRKRDEAVQALCDAGGGNGKVDEKSGYGSCWFDIYDAIAAGKIPGVKLED